MGNGQDDRLGIRWAVHPSERERLAYIDGLGPERQALREGDVIVRPFLVDPTTRQPVPVRVVQIVVRRDHRPPFRAVVVSRADAPH